MDLFSSIRQIVGKEGKLPARCQHLRQQDKNMEGKEKEAFWRELVLKPEFLERVIDRSSTSAQQVRRCAKSLEGLGDALVEVSCEMTG